MYTVSGPTSRAQYSGCWTVGMVIGLMCRSQWPRRLRRGSAAARLLGLRVRIPPGAWVSCVGVFVGR